MMAHNSRDIVTDSHSFQDIMNGVSVKISERYRPPRKVTISSGVLQRKNHEDLSFCYDFSLEESIASKMRQMKQLRSESRKTQKKYLANYQDAILKNKQSLTATTGNEKDVKNEDNNTHSVEHLERQANVPTEDTSPETCLQDITAPPEPSPYPMSTVSGHMSQPSYMSQPSHMSQPRHMSQPSHMSQQYEPILSPVTFEQFNSHQAPASDYPNSHESSGYSNPSQTPINPHPDYQNPHVSSNFSNPCQTPPISSPSQYSNPSSQIPVSSPVQFIQNQDSPDPPTKASFLLYSQNPTNTPKPHVEHLSNDDGHSNNVSSSPLHSNAQYHLQNLPNHNYPVSSSSMCSTNYPLDPTNNASNNTHSNHVSSSSMSLTSYPLHSTENSNTIPSYQSQQHSMYVNSTASHMNPNNSVNTAPTSVNTVPTSYPVHYSHYSVPQSNYVTTSSSLGSPMVHSIPSSTAPDLHTLMRGSEPPADQGHDPKFNASVLQPTHLLSNVQNRTVTKDKQKRVNVQDFENDTSSPFDNVELKSINDIEELRHVLEQTVLIQQQLKQQHETNMQQMQHQQDQQRVQLLQQYHSQHDQHAAQFKPYPTHQYAPNYVLPYSSGVPHNETPTFHNLTYQGAPRPLSTPPFHNMAHQGVLSHPINPAFIPHERQHYQPSQPHGLPQSNTILPSLQPHNPHDLNTMLPSTSIRVSEQQHDNNAYSQISSEMRERKSSRESCDVPRVPSILSQLRDELKRKQEERLSPPQISSPSPGASTPSVCDTSPGPTPPPRQVSHLHTPYLSLPASSQTLVDQITEMGFLQSRTARACAHFGPYQEKIIIFLLQVLSLEEKFPSLSGTDECELCLLQFKCDMTATTEFLSHVVNLMRLGFDAHRVVQALRSAGNNEERALDILVS